jgi:hypothetical protein
VVDPKKYPSEPPTTPITRDLEYWRRLAEERYRRIVALEESVQALSQRIRHLRLGQEVLRKKPPEGR